jgi:hypothetical protein
MYARLSNSCGQPSFSFPHFPDSWDKLSLCALHIAFANCTGIKKSDINPLACRPRYTADGVSYEMHESRLSVVSISHNIKPVWSLTAKQVVNECPLGISCILHPSIYLPKASGPSNSGTQSAARPQAVAWAVCCIHPAAYVPETERAAIGSRKTRCEGGHAAWRW